MHSKSKGTIGELSIATDLAKQGFFVFKELGDLSKIDLIAEKETKLYKIQIKAVTEKEGKVRVPSRKSGPHYNFRYTKEMVNIFAVYVLNHNEIFYIAAKELCKTRSGLTFRYSTTKNGQSKKVKFWADYRDVNQIINNL